MSRRDLDTERGSGDERRIGYNKKAMPSRNSLKKYKAGGFYHVYNRGVEKRVIFEDDLDHRVFLNYFKIALSPRPQTELKSNTEPDLGIERLRRQNFYKDVSLHAYCLMPNHFHLLISQRSQDGIQRLMRSVMSGYVRYFNKRHQRVGGLFQGVYKASLINSEKYLLHVSRYIHLNVLDLGMQPIEYPYSSFPNYVGIKEATWLKPQPVLELFDGKNEEYEDFLYDYADHRSAMEKITHVLADR